MSLFEMYKHVFMEREKQTGAFLEYDLEPLARLYGLPPEEEPEGKPLAGIPFGVKDNIAVEKFGLTCASKSLDGFRSPYTATAVARLQEAGALVIGKTNMDEFGMGSSTDNSAVKQTNNPWDLSRVPGGSSGGSAAAVAAGMVPFALGSDTGGSVRQPAAFCGIYGLKPTYGAVSRYGLVAYASSLEVIGILSSCPKLLSKVFSIIRGKDPMDQTSVDYSDSMENPGAPAGVPGEGNGNISASTIGVLPAVPGLSREVEKAYLESIDRFRGLGYRIVTVELPTLEYAIPAYYTISSAEASANLARYTGIRYGYRTPWSEDPGEMMSKSRDESLGEEVKLRILLGTYVLRSGFQDRYYLRAQKIRRAISIDFERIFGETDLLLMPVFPVPAFKHGEPSMDQFQQKLADRFTVSANLAGIPALSFPVPVPENGPLPIGMQLMAPRFGESRLFDTVQKHAEMFPAPAPPQFGDWKTGGSR